MDLEDKVVWVTGASSGIGAATAELASRRGARLVLTARRIERLEEVRKQCLDPKRVELLPFDLTDIDGHAARTKSAIEAFGQVDCLINNAGISQRGRVQDTDLDVDRRIMEINYFAVIALTKAVLPHLIERRTGNISVLSSVAGYVGTKQRSAYAASKHAVRAYYDSLRAEVHEYGITVTVVCPGYIKTEISQSALTGGGERFGTTDENIARGLSPERAAQAVVAGIEKGREEVYVGGKELAAIYLKRLAPGVVSRLVRGMKEV